MVREINYINIREVLSRLLRHPLLQECNLEQAIQYTIDFMGIFGFPNTYEHKETEIPIEEFRGELPCDLISIDMVKDCKTGIALRSMTSMFDPRRHKHPKFQELQFKTQGRTIYTSFPCGKIHLAYRAVHVDDEGFPMLIDNPKYLKALELYIKCQVFTILFDLGKITPQVLNHTEQEYGWAAGQLSSEFKIPSVSEMESIKNMLNQILVRDDEFISGFDRLGNRETRIIHNSGAVPENSSAHIYHGDVAKVVGIDASEEELMQEEKVGPLTNADIDEVAD